MRRRRFGVLRVLVVFGVVLAGLVTLAPASAAGPGWIQTGPDIDGEAASDLSGISVATSADGTRVAVGARFNDGNGSDAGHVRVFDFDGVAWVQVGADIDGEAAGDSSGRSVALSADGTRLAIGAPNNDGSGGNAGHVRVFDFDGVAWVQVGADIDGEAAGDESGGSVALSADGARLAVGAVVNGSFAGHVRVFDFDGVAWVQVGADIDGEAVNDSSGTSVALTPDGARLAVGATENDGNGSSAGHVRVFDFDGVAWVQVGADIDGEAVNDFSGRSVAFSADGARLAVGAFLNDGNGSNAGHVRVFDFDGVAWVQVGADIDGGAADDRLGTSLALSADGTRVAAGAFAAGSFTGHVRVFDFDGVAWVQVGADIDGEAAGDQSGVSVAISADGARLAIGATNNSGSATAAGHVRVWTLDDVAPDVAITTPADGALFGLNVAATTAFTCTDASGVASCVSDPPGSVLDTSSLGDKTFTVTGVDNAGNETVIAHTYTVVPVVVPGGVGVTEGNSGTVTASVPVRLSAPSTETVSVEWATVDADPNPIAAQAGSDFVSASGTVVFAPGQTEKFVDVQVKGDLVDEPPLSFEFGIVEFSDPTNAVMGTGSIAGLGFFVIYDDDPTPVITPGHVALNPEGDLGDETSVFVPVTMSNPSSVPVSIDWTTLDTGAPKIATADEDYVADSGTLTIPAGSTTGFVEIIVKGDDIDEPPLLYGEWGLVLFSNPTNATLNTQAFFGASIFIIVDDD